MPTRYMVLTPIPPEQRRRIAGLPTMRQLNTKFPKRALAGAADAKRALRKWQDDQPAPKAVRNPDVAIKAARVTRAALTKLRAVTESDAGPAEILNQKLSQEALFGTLYSALTTYEFMKLQAEYKRRKSSGRALAQTEQQWQEIVKAAQMAHSVGGLRGLRESDLNRAVDELVADRKNLDAVIRIANSATSAESTSALTSRSTLYASLVPWIGVLADIILHTTPIPDLCDEPFAEGSFTKHFSKSISLSVKIPYWCPTWTNPFKTCTKTVTLAGVSFSIGLNVGYKVSCCGATAWGQAYAQACATIVGISVCASCSATVTGVAGVSRTPVSSGCSYGLGINAVLECKLAGATILYASVPFGWTITGPCPPAGLCP